MPVSPSVPVFLHEVSDRLRLLQIIAHTANKLPLDSLCMPSCIFDEHLIDKGNWRGVIVKTSFAQLDFQHRVPNSAPRLRTAPVPP